MHVDGVHFHPLSNGIYNSLIVVTTFALDCALLMVPDITFKYLDNKIAK